jgi:hypothetical protein
VTVVAFQGGVPTLDAFAFDNSSAGTAVVSPAVSGELLISGVMTYTGSNLTCWLPTNTSFSLLDFVQFSSGVSVPGASAYYVDPFMVSVGPQWPIYSCGFNDWSAGVVILVAFK